ERTVGDGDVRCFAFEEEGVDAGAGRDDGIGDVRVDVIVAAAGNELIDAGPADELIVAGAAGERIVAVAAVEVAGALPALQNIVPFQPDECHAALELGGVERVVVAGADNHDRLEAAGRDAVAVDGDQV